MDRDTLNRLSAQVAQEKRADFAKELRNAKNLQQIGATLEKYGVELSKEEKTLLTPSPKAALSLDDLEAVSGGCGDSNSGGNVDEEDNYYQEEAPGCYMWA